MSITQNIFFKKLVTILNSLHDVKINFRKLPTYNKAKTIFEKQYFILYKEDPTVANYGKTQLVIFPLDCDATN